jgi:hypothetical protein
VDRSPGLSIEWVMSKSNRKPTQKLDDPNLALELNGISLSPGIDLHSSQWAGLRESLKAKRLGMMEKRNLGALWRETMYRVDNPTLSAFEGEFSFAPRSHQFEEPPAAHLADSLWRTSGLICFWGGHLFRWIAQVSGDSQAAELFFSRAEAKAGSLFGPSKKTDRGLIWKLGDGELMLNMGPAEAVLLLTFRPDRLVK